MHAQTKIDPSHDLNSEWIISSMEADSTLAKLYNKTCNGWRGLTCPRKRITTHVNALFSLLSKNSEKGELSQKFSLQAPNRLNSDILDLTKSDSDERALVYGFFSKCLGITVIESQQILTASWETSNLYLNVKPTYRAPQIKVDNGYFKHLLKTHEDSDITFIVEGKEVKAHSLLLKRSPYFKSLLSGNWKENTTTNTPISFPDYSYAMFTEMLHYLYVGTFSENISAADCESYIELWELSNYLGIPDTTLLCKQELYSMINKENFLSIALLQMRINDPDLETLCKWFIRTNIDLADGLDISALSPTNLLLIHAIGKKYKSSPLAAAALIQLKKSLALDAEFISLCQHIQQTKETELKRYLETVLRENIDLFNKLKEGKKDLYKEQWKAFKEVMTNVSI